MMVRDSEGFLGFIQTTNCHANIRLQPEEKRKKKVNVAGGYKYGAEKGKNTPDKSFGAQVFCKGIVYDVHRL
ncbi:hypothetical protein JCM30197_11540 [Schleiferia thermophila]|jgi:hypothetical protein|nr:hypothetical protein JCM30197_11540 [Schleiferia thermophila]